MSEQHGSELDTVLLVCTVNCNKYSVVDLFLILFVLGGILVIISTNGSSLAAFMLLLV